jgi:hypothetical protein
MSLPATTPRRGDDDLEHATEMVAIYRRMLVEGFARHCDDFAYALNALRNEQRRRRLAKPALATSTELVAVCRRMLLLDERRYRPALASVLLMAAEDEPDPVSALPLADEAVTLMIEAAERDPGERVPLLGAFVTQAVLLRDMQQPAESWRAADEALRIGRLLVAEDPGAHRADLIGCLHRISRELPHSVQSLPWCYEAVQLARLIAVDDLDEGLPALVEALRELATQLAAGGQRAPARAAFAEAAAIQRHLPLPGTPHPCRAPAAPVAPGVEPRDPVDELVAVSDVVCRLRRLRDNDRDDDRDDDQEAAQLLPAWLDRQAQLLTRHGLDADAELVRADLTRLRAGGAQRR